MFNSKDEIITFVQLLINAMSSDKIKIVHVEDRFHPDMGYQLNFTAKYYDKDKFEMHIITSESLRLWSHDEKLTKKVIAQKDNDFESKFGIFIHRLPTKYEKKNGYNLLMSGIVKKIYSLKPDVLFIHAIESYTTFLLLNKTRLYRDSLVCCDTHTLYNQFRKTFVENLYFSLFKKIVIPKLKRFNSPVFYTASENKEILIKQYGISKKNIYPYIIGTDNNIFYPNIKSGIELRKELDIEKGKKVILYTGKFNNPKSPHLIIDALIKSDAELPDYVLVMVGGKNKDYFNKYFNKKELLKNGRTIILNAVNVSQLNDFYNMADVVVFPKENTLSALDCQLSGTPVIMEDDLTNRERLKKGGLTYKPGDIDDLSKKIKILLKDDFLREKLGKDGFRFILENFNYPNIIKNMESVILEKLNLKKRN